MHNPSGEHDRPEGACPPQEAGQEPELQLVLETMESLIGQLAPLLYGDYEVPSGEMPDARRKWEMECVFRKIQKLWPIWRSLSRHHQVDQELVSVLDRDLIALAELWDNAEDLTH